MCVPNVSTSSNVDLLLPGQTHSLIQHTGPSTEVTKSPESYGEVQCFYVNTFV